MAENEILDFGGRRWLRTRATLAQPSVSLTEIAQCVGDDLNRGLQRALRDGTILQQLLRATQHSPAAAQAVVNNAKDKELARTIRLAVKVARSTDPAVIARCAVEILLDKVRDKTLGIAARNGRFEEPDQRAQLAQAVMAELEDRRSGLVATIEANLRGSRSLLLRPGRAPRAPAPRSAASMVNASLAVLKGNKPEGPGHG